MLQDDYNDLEAEDEDVLSVYLIVVVPDDPNEMTVNLKGPVVINDQEYIGKQIVNQVDEYGVKHRLLDEIDDQSNLQMAGEES